MIYYTVVSADELFGEEEAERSLIPVVVNGCSMLVEPLGNGQARVERLLSTDPNQYMEMKFQPGSVINGVYPQPD